LLVSVDRLVAEETPGKRAVPSGTRRRRRKPQGEREPYTKGSPEVKALGQTVDGDPPLRDGQLLHSLLGLEKVDAERQ
jgi:hypothetical protein